MTGSTILSLCGIAVEHPLDLRIAHEVEIRRNNDPPVREVQSLCHRRRPFRVDAAGNPH